jgi:hypothetical protein
MSDRVPYAERPDVIARHCQGCRYPIVESDEPRNEGEARPEWTRSYTDPDCPLHGDHAKEAPY